ncbi:MAG: ribulose-phosphate 3-epimerase [Planctomycetota bacterium]|nr:MAG: ribulose-phosphate 3-epimerase [Planctomycetota bacterium]
MIISPSILSADFLNLRKEVEETVLGGADWIHVDVMDGHFVPNLSIGIPIIHCLKKAFSLPLDVHLMISHPDEFIQPFINAGADILTFHIEASKNPKELCSKIHDYEKKVGIALKPGTPLDKIKDLLPFVDMVLIMTVEPGFSGQAFMEAMLEKIRVLRHQWNWQGTIQVDGGIRPETALKCKEAGANAFVAASFIFQGEPKKNTRLLREEILKK